jgi:hypothetical protein
MSSFAIAYPLDIEKIFDEIDEQGYEYIHTLEVEPSDSILVRLNDC